MAVLGGFVRCQRVCSWARRVQQAPAPVAARLFSARWCRDALRCSLIAPGAMHETVSAMGVGSGQRRKVSNELQRLVCRQGLATGLCALEGASM